MLQEINNFMNSLPAELKQAGLKPKEGLHVLLKIQEKEGTHFMDEQSVCRVCLTRKATEFDYPFLQHCAELAQVGWCVNTNKCFDLPAKGLHSCSPYCIGNLWKEEENMRKIRLKSTTVSILILLMLYPTSKRIARKNKGFSAFYQLQRETECFICLFSVRG